MRLAAVLFAAAIALSGCSLALRSPSVAELKYNPARYHQKTVNIEGVVTSAWAIPMVPFKMYKVDDGTGEVIVLSQGQRTPTRGARVRVRGRMDDIGVIGGQPFGLHIREHSLHVKRR
jgi:hypothetical protein